MTEISFFGWLVFVIYSFVTLPGHQVGLLWTLNHEEPPSGSTLIEQKPVSYRPSTAHQTLFKSAEDSKVR